MVGNIIEWVRGVLGDGETVIRSGAYFFGSTVASSYNRTVVDPKWNENVLGFRVCAPPQP
jgi:hypothetical protein